MLETFKQLKPDFFKLTKLIRYKLEIAQKSLKQEDYEEILQEYEQAIESIGHDLHEDRNSSDSDSPEGATDGLQKPPTAQLSAVHQLFSNLTLSGFSDFKLLFKVGSLLEFVKRRTKCLNI